jgi:hypothetical protein
MPIRVIHRHDTSVMPRVRFLDEGGGPIAGLDTATIRYTLRAVGTGTLKVTRALATPANQTTFPGEVYYQFVPGDVDTAGIYAEEWEITYVDGTKETFPAKLPQYVEILADYDNV